MLIGGPNARAVDGNETRSEVDGLARGREGTVRERNLRDSQRRGLIIDCEQSRQHRYVRSL